MLEIAFVEALDCLPDEIRVRLEQRLHNIATSLGNAQDGGGTLQDSVVVLVIGAWRIQYRVEAAAQRLLVEEALFLGRE